MEHDPVEGGKNPMAHVERSGKTPERASVQERTMSNETERVYLVFDARAALGGTDDATVLESFRAGSDAQAKRKATQTWDGPA